MNFTGEPHSDPHENVPSVESVCRIAPEGYQEFIRWIDPLKDKAEVHAALTELRRRQQLQAHSPPPLEARIEDRRVAGAYMILLGARVAALAGVRAIDNHTLSAVRLLNQLVDDVRLHGVVQVQAILDGTDSVATEIVQLAGFAPLAELLQLILPLPSSGQSAEPGTGSATPRALPRLELPPDLQWVHGGEAPREKLMQLIAHTFIETLDCPALNGMRSPADVLEGFLDGQDLQAQEGWWIIATKEKEKYLGCVLVNRLPNGSAELVYMGLGPTSRGRGYGRLLLDQGIATARALGGEMLVAAVDCANWPASRLYTQAGFHENARVQAWFHRPGQ